MIELINERPHTEEEIEIKWPNCHVWLHSYEADKENPALSKGIPYLIMEEKDCGVVKRTICEFPQFSKKAIISTHPILDFLGNYPVAGEDYGG